MKHLKLLLFALLLIGCEKGEEEITRCVCVVYSVRLIETPECKLTRDTINVSNGYNGDCRDSVNGQMYGNYWTETGCNTY